MICILALNINEKMKKISFILLVLLAVSFSMSTTSCSDDTPPIVTQPEDTTGTVEITNKITVGFDSYELTLDETLTSAFYKTTNQTSVINVYGNDATLGNADFQITIPGQAVGTFTSHNNGGANVEIGTGEGVRREEFNTNGTEFTVVVTEFGAVGEAIKGTFSGTVKDKFSKSVTVKNGTFDVIRTKDQ